MVRGVEGEKYRWRRGLFAYFNFLSLSLLRASERTCVTRGKNLFSRTAKSKKKKNKNFEKIFFLFLQKKKILIPFFSAQPARIRYIKKHENHPSLSPFWRAGAFTADSTPNTQHTHTVGGWCGYYTSCMYLHFQDAIHLPLVSQNSLSLRAHNPHPPSTTHVLPTFHYKSHFASRGPRRLFTSYQPPTRRDMHFNFTASRHRRWEISRCARWK